MMIRPKSILLILTTAFLAAHLILPSYGTQVIAYLNSSTDDMYVALKEEIFNRKSVKYKIPPEISNQQSVMMTFTPFQVRYVEEVKQTVGLACLTIISWYIQDLTWDPAKYGGIEALDIDRDKIWSPVISSPKSAYSPLLHLPTTVQLTPGGVEAEIPGLLATICQFDISDFPFDIHNCSIPFIEMNGYQLIFNASETKSYLLKKHFKEVTEWTLLDSSCTLIEDNDKDTGSFFRYTQCWFIISRKSIFYITNIVIPVFLMAIMTLCVFLIPAESGEKISFMISLFVSMAVFVNFIMDIIPRSMTRTPRLVALIIAIMVKLLLCTIASSLVLRRYYAGQKDEQIREKLERDNERVDDYSLRVFDHQAEMEEFNRDNNKNENEAYDFNNKRKNRCIDRHGITRIKVNQVGIEQNIVSNISESRYQQQGKESLGAIPKVCNKSSGRCKNLMTHSQMDRCFFYLFLIASFVTYTSIIVLPIP